MENVTAYLKQERRGFAELAPTDVDLLALCALLYAEFERFPHFLEPGTSTRVGDLLAHGSARAYVEHDCNPAGMEPLVEAIAASPRYADVRLERFRCVVAETPEPVQFGAACFRISDNLVIVAFRGTDSKLVGWQEDLEMTWREAAPGQRLALSYLREAAGAYPGARLVVCGHSKGGSEAEYAALLAEPALAARIDRAVSFDGPSLFKRGGKMAPELEACDRELLERYARLGVPLTRYVFPSTLGLILERRDTGAFPFVDAVDARMPHNVCSARVRDGALVRREPTQKELATPRRISDAIARLNLEERRFAGDFIVAACRQAGIGISLSDEGLARIRRALLARYRTAPAADRRAARGVVRKLL